MTLFLHIQRAPVQQRVFTSKELAALALMKSDSQEDSDDGDSICYDYPSTSNPDQVAHSSHKSVSPTGSGISLSPARPDLRHEGEEGTAVVQSEAADQVRVVCVCD